MKKLLLLLNVCFAAGFAQSQCLPPINIITYPGQISVEVHFSPVTVANYFDLYICPAGSPAPESFYPPTVSSSGFEGQIYYLGLVCDTAYNVYVRSVCDDNVTSGWSSPYAFYTQPCTTFHNPQDLSACPVNGESCFDLHQNDETILGGTFSEDMFDIHYYGSMEDFGNGTNEIDNACVSSGSKTVYVFVQDNFTQDTDAFQFQVTALSDTCSGLNLNAFLDSNNNGVKDPGENNFPYGQFNYELNDDGNTHFVASSTATQTLYDNNPASSYDLGFSIDAPYNSFFSTPATSYTNVNPPAAGFVSYDFPIVATAGYRDVAVSLIAYSGARPNSEYLMAVKYTNMGNQPESGTITFNLSQGLFFGSAYPSAGGSVTVTPTGFTYGFSNLAAFQTETIVVNLSTPNVPTISIGQLLETTVFVSSSDSDAIASNNTSTVVQAVFNSHDPNDKMEAHGTEIDTGSFTAEDYLTYTIRFENTGNADALNIKVTDLLDDQLDASTVRMVSASHEGVMDRVGQNITWRFNSINLPPVSQTDALQGHGYLTFEVKPVAGFGVGDVVPNGASIYFDFNPAIVTNTFETHFVETLGLNAFENQSFAMYPNPVRDKLTVTSNGANIEKVAIFEVSGKQIQLHQGQKSSSAILDISGLQTGMYFVKVTTDNGLTSTKKLMKE